MPLVAALEGSRSACTRGISRSPRSFSATPADTPCASANVKERERLSEIGGAVDVASPRAGRIVLRPPMLVEPLGVELAHDRAQTALATLDEPRSRGSRDRDTEERGHRPGLFLVGERNNISRARPRALGHPAQQRGLDIGHVTA